MDIATSSSTCPLKACRACHTILPLTSFHRNRARPDGRQDICPACSKRIREAAQAADPKAFWAYENTRAIKSRAKRKGIPFALTTEYVLSIAPDVCPVLGFPLQYGRVGHTGGNPESPSVDRIKGELGYIHGNIIIVSWQANAIRHVATPDQIYRVAEFYSRLLST